MTNPASEWPTAPETPNEPAVYCREPDYSAWLTPLQIRRMSKMIRMGVSTARLCVEGLPAPDSIHVGTAYGLLEETETFLKKMIDRQEQMLPPTAFIQSTHNTVAGQIALLLDRNVHNMTFVHKGHSFESAMMDAMLLQEEGNALVGGCDILTATSRAILTECGVYSPSVLAGEGAAFFHVSGKKSENTLARISALELHYSPEHTSVYPWIKQQLQKLSVPLDPEDILLDGMEHKPDRQSISAQILSDLFQAPERFNFKNICGHYPTAVAFGVACGLQYLVRNPSRKCCILHHSGPFWSFWILEGKDRL